MFGEARRLVCLVWVSIEKWFYGDDAQGSADIWLLTTSVPGSALSGHTPVVLEIVARAEQAAKGGSRPRPTTKRSTLWSCVGRGVVQRRWWAGACWRGVARRCGCAPQLWHDSDHRAGSLHGPCMQSPQWYLFHTTTRRTQELTEEVFALFFHPIPSPSLPPHTLSSPFLSLSYPFLLPVLRSSPLKPTTRFGGAL